MNTKTGVILGLLATVVAAAFAPVSALADSRQDNKNLWRNGTILGGAAALYGLAKHNTTATLLGAGAAAYSANRYEQDRHSQSQQQAAQDQARYYRSYSNSSYGTPHRSYSRRTTRYYHTTGYSRPYGRYVSSRHASYRSRSRRTCRCPR